jgi:hypothetical protein
MITVFRTARKLIVLKARPNASNGISYISWMSFARFESANLNFHHQKPASNVLMHQGSKIM